MRRRRGCYHRDCYRRGWSLNGLHPDGLLPDGSPLRMSGVSFDMTGWKRAERQLLEADRRKDEFLALLAHELRNPLAPLRNVFFTQQS